MKVNTTGKIIKIGDLQTISDKFQKQEVIVDITAPESNYPNQICIEAHNGDTDRLQYVKEGDEVDVSFFINGKYWEKGDRYFNTLKLSFIKKSDAAAQGNSTPPPPLAGATPDTAPTLPF